MSLFDKAQRLNDLDRDENNSRDKEFWRKTIADLKLRKGVILPDTQPERSAFDAWK